MKKAKLSLMVLAMFMFFAVIPYAAGAVGDAGQPGQTKADYTTETTAGTEYFEIVPEEQETPESFEGASPGGGSGADDLGGDL